MSLVDDEVPPGDVLQRPLLQVGHLVRRDELSNVNVSHAARHAARFFTIEYHNESDWRDGPPRSPSQTGCEVAECIMTGQSGELIVTIFAGDRCWPLEAQKEGGAM